MGYSIDRRMISTLVVNALRNVIRLRRPNGMTVHSDRGSKFQSRACVGGLRDAGLSGSIDDVGASADNAATEMSFALLHQPVPNRQRWSSRENLRLAIVNCMEATYHRGRRQKQLGRLKPIEHDTLRRAAPAGCPPTRPS